MSSRVGSNGRRSAWRAGCVALVMAGLGLAGCGEDAPLHERSCGDGVDNDRDGRVDCDDTDCYGTVQCPVALCGNGVVEGSEECDEADLDGWTCGELGYEGGTLACDPGCYLDITGCTSEPGCGNGLVDPGEECDGNNLDGGSCAALGFMSGVLACDASCLFETSGCEDPLLPECFVPGNLTAGVAGELSCSSEVGVMQWDHYTLEVTAGDCVDIVVDNGAGDADLVAIALDADGITAYGWADDFSQLDDEYPCQNTPWSDWACPAALVEAVTDGTFTIYVAQWFDDTGTQPGVDTCSFGMSGYTLYVGVNGEDITPTLALNDQPL